MFPLLATCWTTSGDAAPDRPDLRSPLPLRDRVGAAARAGFTGFGLHSADLPAAVDTYGLSGIRTLLADHGITHVELEEIPAWWAGDGRADAVRDLLLQAAEALGARHLKVTPDGTAAAHDRAQWARAFRDLAGRAADVGCRLGIEFFPWSNIATPEDALRLVDDAGHDAGGLIVDVWHTERGGTPPAALAGIPLERIVGVELNDAAARVVGTLFEDTVHRRRYCGEGAFDLPGVITALHTAGWRGPWGVEILSDAHRTLDVATASARAADSATVVLGDVLGG